jgi:hypothetical protein
MNRSHRAIRFLDGQRCEVVIAEGELCEVRPAHGHKKAHRGRICRVEALDDYVLPRRARVRYEDNNRIGLVNIDDLVEVEPEALTV